MFEDLEAADWEKLTEKIREIIAWGIDTNEMTPEEYLAGRGKEYSNIPNLRVYGLEGKPCRKCNDTMVNQSNVKNSHRKYISRL